MIDGFSRPMNGKLYAALIATSAIFLIAMVLWPLTVRQFVTSACFEVSYEPSSGLDKSKLNQLVVTSMRDAMRPEAVVESLRRLEIHAPLKSELLKAADLETLGSAIKINWQEGLHANSVEYRVALTGSGTQDEVDFLNDLIVRINSELGNRIAGERTAGAISDVTGELSKLHAGTVEQFAQQVNDVIRQVESARRELDSACESLQSAEPAIATSSEPVARPADATPDDERAALMAERSQLLAQPGMTQWHPQVTALQKKIESLPVASPEAPKSEVFAHPSTANAAVVKNQFVGANAPNRSVPAANASSTRTEPAANPAPQAVASELKSIDLETPARQLGDLEERIRLAESNAGSFAERIQRRSMNAIVVHSPIHIEDIQKAQASTPVGGTPQGRDWLWLMVASASLGIGVAFAYSPAGNIRRFRGPLDLETKLGVPVLGTIQTSTGLSRDMPLSRWMAIRAVRISEWSLLGGTVLLLMAALINSRFAGDFFENPFHAIINTVWLLMSRNP